MYIKLADTVANVIGVSADDMTASFDIQDQTDVNAVLNAVQKEIRLYEDPACTKLAAIYRADRIIRISYEPDNALIHLMVQAAMLPDVEAEQIRETLRRQEAVITGQAARLDQQDNLIREQQQTIASLQDELSAAKILLGIEEGGQV